ncbi:MAG: hypothetical protein WDZ59_01750 [Pirellulales bacterium]
MPKVLTILGLIASGLIGLMFLADLAIGIPFGGISMIMDICFIAAAAILGYLSWSALRELG